MKTVKTPTALALALAFLAAPAIGLAATKKKPAKPYPLDKCLISGKKLDLTSKKLHTIEYKGQKVTFCCPMCVGDFQKEPAKYLAKIKKAAKKVKPYPLKTCVVSGEELGGMGDPYVLVYHSQEIKLCCKGCLKDFAKAPDSYLKKIPTARK